MNTENNSTSLKELLERWNAVQGDLKEAEQIGQLAVIPAINELRYAGRILVTALSQELYNTGNPENTEVSTAITIANQYITNADHDISDALIYTFQKRVDEINLRYGAQSVINKDSNYANIVKNLETARTLTIESRKDLQKRPENYKEIKKIARVLTHDYFSLDKTEIFMAIEVESLKKRAQKYEAVSMLLGALFIGSILTYIFFLRS